MKSKPVMAILISAAVLAGCAGANNTLNAGGPYSTPGIAPAVGTAYSSGFVYGEASSNAYIGVLMLGLVAAGVHDDYLSSTYGTSAARVPPQLLEDRAITERDCSQPMEAPSANLRCK